MEDQRAAQAVKFISALRDHVNEMMAQVAWLERKGARAKSSSMVSATRVEAAALRRDISEARVLIDRLHSRYLTAHERRTTAMTQSECRSRCE